MTDLVFSDVYFRTAERDSLPKCLAEIERLTDIGPPCEAVLNADDAVSTILDNLAADHRAARSSCALPKGSPLQQKTTPLIAGTAAEL